jgi:hypothetical protein
METPKAAILRKTKRKIGDTDGIPEHAQENY